MKKIAILLAAFAATCCGGDIDEASGVGCHTVTPEKIVCAPDTCSVRVRCPRQPKPFEYVYFSGADFSANALCFPTPDAPGIFDCAWAKDRRETPP